MLQFLLSSLILLCPLLAESAESALLQMETDRNPSDIHPREDTLGMRIFIHSADGRPVSGARLKIHLQAPDTPWIGSTDFPVVEDTSLLNQDLHVPGATYSFQFVPPIRGTYTLTASVEPLPGDDSFAPTQTSWQTTITESPARKKNLGILLTILVLVGGISGFIIGRGPRTSAALALLFFLWPHSPLKAHGSHQHKKAPVPPAEITPGADGGRIELELLTKEPRVGELTELMARYIDAQGQRQAAEFRLDVTQLEHERLVFSSKVHAPDGILRWQGQLFDGSPHRVTITALPLRAQGTQKEAKVERDIEVIGVEPPLRSVIKSFGLLMLVTALALTLGIMLGRYFPLQKGGLT